MSIYLNSVTGLNSDFTILYKKTSKKSHKMPFSEKTQRLRHLRKGFSESARNSELQTIIKPFGLRHVIKSGSSHSLAYM